MLNAGLATLDALKARLLPEAARADTDYDAALSSLGLAIAVRMERHLGRQLPRLVGAVDEFSAWTLSVTLRRYPVEVITLVQTRDPAGLLDPVATEYATDAACGLVDFWTTPGHAKDRLLITYTGGYWLDDGEVMPAGATPLPADLLEIWAAEVQLHAEARGIFGAAGLRGGSASSAAKAPAGLSEDAVDGLRAYRRFAGE